jgi:hypothetical protein
MPELMRTRGEPNDPADRITSLEAVIVTTPDELCGEWISTVRISRILESFDRPFEVSDTRVTIVFRRICKFFRDWV